MIYAFKTETDSILSWYMYEYIVFELLIMGNPHTMTGAHTTDRGTPEMRSRPRQS